MQRIGEAKKAIRASINLVPSGSMTGPGLTSCIWKENQTTRKLKNMRGCTCCSSSDIFLKARWALRMGESETVFYNWATASARGSDPSCSTSNPRTQMPGCHRHRCMICNIVPWPSSHRHRHIVILLPSSYRHPCCSIASS
jgi:hypothetical protein